MTCWAGWSSIWNQGCWEKYQQSQICRWYHFNDRAWRGTKEPLDEGQRGEWKSWLKTQHSKNWDHGIQSHHFMASRRGESGNSVSFHFGGLQNQCKQWLQPWNWKMLAPWKKNDNKPRHCIKMQKHHFANKGPYSQNCVFSSHVWMWELDHKEGWALKNWCFWTVVPVKTLESPLNSKEMKPVNPKGNQPWIFIGRTDAEGHSAEAEAPMLWPPDARHRLIWKDPDAGKDWGQDEEGTTEDEMVGWHNRLNGHEFEQTQGDGEGQGSLACCISWGRKESDTT